MNQTQELIEKQELLQLELDIKYQETKLKNCENDGIQQKENDKISKHQTKCETARRNIETVYKFIQLEETMRTNITWKANKEAFLNVLETNLPILVNKDK
jgi:hypothetical protein